MATGLICRMAKNHLDHIEKNPKSAIFSIALSLCAFPQMSFYLKNDLVNPDCDEDCAVTLSLLISAVISLIGYGFLLGVFALAIKIVKYKPIPTAAESESAPLLTGEQPAAYCTCACYRYTSDRLNKLLQYTKNQHVVAVVAQLTGGFTGAYYGAEAAKTLFYSLDENNTVGERITVSLFALLAFVLGYIAATASTYIAATATTAAAEKITLTTKNYFFPAGTAAGEQKSVDTSRDTHIDIKELIDQFQTQLEENKQINAELKTQVSALTAQVRQNNQLGAQVADMNGRLDLLNVQIGRLTTACSTTLGQVGDQFGLATPAAQRRMSMASTFVS